MIPRFLFISLATILLSSILLFIYFKNRISTVEEKVDVIFQLVQNHTDNREQMRVYESTPQQSNANLIEVSDREQDDDESDSDESNTSEEESDEENEEKLNLEDDLILEQGDVLDTDNIKKIALDLETNVDDLEPTELILEKKDNDEDNEEDNEEDNVDYKGFKVSQLKQLCEEKNLENYKSLKKAELIELLQSS